MITGRPVIAVFDDPLRSAAPLEFGVYVGYDHHPTAADVAELEALGLTGVKPYLYIDYVRARATFAQVQEIAASPAVRRVESIPMTYPTNHWGSRVVRARDSQGLNKSQSYSLFPGARAELGLDGTGIVIAVLDTGVNDETDSVVPLYPGHESLKGKFLAGGEFYFGDPLLNTPVGSSMNPEDHGSAGSSYHATHVAGSAMGTGGPDGFFAGVAPAARLVDCKVLSDAGAGFGSADGVEWCIANRNNSWGLTGADTVYAGIDVLNLSLGGLTESDGTDAGSQMITAAIDSGLVVCIATGNDCAQDYIPSPAAADKCISVGATDHFQTLVHDDDQVTDFSNEGPRDDDLDLDHLDEMKPTVVAPGSNIMSANGDPTTDGTAYQLLSGTSMATPHVAGIAALILQANPTLTPLELRDILMHTATHDIASVKGDRANDPWGVDPNYDPGCGWGEADVYAAAKEAMSSTTGVQVVQVKASARPDDLEIDFTWITQREHSFQGFHVHRAPDANGAPGTFAQLTSTPVAGVGSPVIEGTSNRTPYTYVDADAALQLGNRYWYRVDWVDDGSVAHPEPPVPVDFGELPAVAIVSFSFFHNTPDNDLLVRMGTSHGHDADNPVFAAIGFPEAQADSAVVDSVLANGGTGTGTLGYIEWFHHYSLTALDNVSGFLPPDPTWPWFLSLTEGGYINRMGRVTSFQVFVPDTPGGTTGTTHVTDSPLPAPTAETLTTTVWIPEGAVDAPALVPGNALTHLRVTGPNPFSDRVGLTYAVGRDRTVSGNAPVRLSVHDVQGRLVRVLQEGVPGDGERVASWDGRDDGGSRVTPGVYFLRLRAGAETKTAKAVLVR
jgi:subtilisin family serine protease